VKTDLADVSVIICAYSNDRWNDLVEAVRSIQKQELPPKETVVVIDHNTGLYKKASAELQSTIVVENTQNRGASGARNAGVKASSGRILAFLDDDAIAASDWIKKGVGSYDDPNLLGVVGYVRPLWMSHKPAWFPAEFYWVVGASFKGLPEVTATVRNGWTNNMSVLRSVFESIGGFRTGFGKTGAVSSPEDTDLCIRALQAKPDGKWLYRPDVIVDHKVPADRATWSFFLRRCYLEGLGKAHLVSYVGAADGMSDERAYSIRTLPSGVIRGLLDPFRGDFAGILRAVAIIVGFSVTALGYAVGWLDILSKQIKPKPIPSDTYD
jgi:GT2 family glycosyltransferase